MNSISFRMISVGHEVQLGPADAVVIQKNVALGGRPVSNDPRPAARYVRDKSLELDADLSCPPAERQIVVLRPETARPRLLEEGRETLGA